MAHVLVLGFDPHTPCSSQVLMSCSSPVVPGGEVDPPAVDAGALLMVASAAENLSAEPDPLPPSCSVWRSASELPDPSTVSGFPLQVCPSEIRVKANRSTDEAQFLQ